MALALCSPMEWFDRPDPWQLAAPLLRDGGFPDVAAHAYAALARRLGHVVTSAAATRPEN
jgi:hypothetical protein